MNDYEARQAARRDRLEARAAAAEKESERRHEKAVDSVSHIPFGQPILVGHHSERRHRADLGRYDTNMRASIEADRRAQDLKDRAAAVGKGGISADDPDALPKLRRKLAKRQERQTFMKKANQALRKGDDQALAALGFTADTLAQFRKPDFAGRSGFADFQLRNNNAEIRRLTKRIAQMEKAAAATPAETIEGEGWQLVEAVEDNRIRFVFDEKPSEETRRTLKNNGFRWSPSIGAWQRQLTTAGRHAARQVVAVLR